jgi:inorganic pyrophosphatase
MAGAYPVVGRDRRGSGGGEVRAAVAPAAQTPRRTVVPVRVLGLIHLVDAGDKDDKLIAVPADSPLAKAKDLAELDALFPGITSILETWFENYKGKDALQCSGFGGKADADALLAAGIDSFDASEKGEKKEPAKAAVSDRR